MNTAVVLTFPGHFFLTAMTLESIRYFYPDIKQIYVLYDDQVTAGWPDYVDDCCEWYRIPKNKFISYSQVDSDIAQCPIGWYRQQIVKCSIDLIIPGDRWFVVDGDVVFDEKIDVENITPVQHRSDFNDPLAMSVLKGIKTLLGIDQHPLLSDGRFKITSSIPFRNLEKTVLQALRQQVESSIKGTFTKRITEMIYAHELVVYDATGTCMVMNEWELLEAMNHILYPNRFQIKDIGSGYDLTKHTAMCIPARFRQGYVYDHNMSRSWVEQQIGNDIVDRFWTKAVDYGQYFTQVMNQSI